MSRGARRQANERGRAAERIAAAHVEARGLHILDRGFTARRGEIDIVARDGDDLVFVEVRARASDAPVAGLESVTREKRRKLVHAARTFVVQHGLDDVPVRFDIVDIALRPDGAAETVTWRQGAFTLDDC